MSRAERIEAAIKVWEQHADEPEERVAIRDLRAALAPESGGPHGKVLACSVCGWSAEPCTHIGGWIERRGPVNEREAPSSPSSAQGDRCGAGTCGHGRTCEKPQGHGGNWHDCGFCCWPVVPSLAGGGA